MSSQRAGPTSFSAQEVSNVSNEPGRFVLGMGRTAIVDTADPDPMRSRIALYRGTPVIDLTPAQLEAALAELQKEFPQCPR